MSSINSPHSSPRLPSPPPFTEVQLPPLSPSSDLPPSIPSSTTSTRRIIPGTKSRDIAPGPPLVTPLDKLDSAFQLQEHLSALIASITHPESSPNSSHALTREDCARIATPPDGIDETLWCYELTRRLTRDLNALIVSLLGDDCTAKSCPEMRASEWQFLCAVHDSPQSCCAIDYSTHTLDYAATQLTSTRHFPSRLSVQPGTTKTLESIFRRLYRIFAHAWFQHRYCFWSVEGESGLYLLFKTVSDRYRLIPPSNLTLPPEAEGLKADGTETVDDEEEEDHAEWERRYEDDYSDSDSDEEIIDEEPAVDIDEGSEGGSSATTAGISLSLRDHQSSPLPPVQEEEEEEEENSVEKQMEKLAVEDNAGGFKDDDPGAVEEQKPDEEKPVQDTSIAEQ